MLVTWRLYIRVSGHTSKHSCLLSLRAVFGKGTISLFHQVVLSDSNAVRHRTGRLDEAPDEIKRNGRHFAPATVDRKRVPAIRNFDELGHGVVDLLALERRICNRPRGSVVLLARSDQ